MTTAQELRLIGMILMCIAIALAGIAAAFLYSNDVHAAIWTGCAAMLARLVGRVMLADSIILVTTKRKVP